MVSARQFATAVAILAGLGVAENITGDSYFYGQSPPVYPSPIANGTGDWADAYAKAAALVAQLTLEEKNNLTFGISGTTGCSGEIGPIERVGFPGFCLQDAGNGVRATDFVSGFPSGIHVGASWNKQLAYERAYYMGGEFRAKGVNTALGPVVGPLGRVVTSGRNWEGISNDPYLCGALAAETVKGMQDHGVITCVKHYIGNEQEAYRNPSTNSNNQSVASVSSNIDDKTMHETYLWPFADAVRAGTGSIMCSYNRVNNSYSCQNSKVLNGLLKEELGFQGFVVTDWVAQHAGVATALAGLDMAMPTGMTYWGVDFAEAYTNGSVPESRLDDMATRILAAWYKMGQDSDYPGLGIGMPADISEPHTVVDARDPNSRPTILQGAVEGHVLVKNEGALPLKSPKLLTVYGYDAKSADINMPTTSSVYGNEWQGGEDDILIMSTASALDTVDLPAQFMIAMNGTMISGGGSGANTPSYINAPLDALKLRTMQDGSALLWDLSDAPGTTGVEGVADACLVFINAFAGEGYDRPGVHDDYSDSLINGVADSCNNTIVVIHNAGIRLVDQFVDHPNVTAVIMAHLPGQDSGAALVSLLYGDDNFSGKLPYTVAKNESDYGHVLYHSEPVAPYTLFPQSDFTEGVYIDYRAFDAKNITPRYEFGFGLSYTTFSYSGLAVSTASNASLAEYPSGEILQGGHVDLWDTIATVTAQVSNTGSVDGAEVAQLYVGIPGGPVRQLRGFDKVNVTAGATVDVSFELTRRDLSTWDVVAQAWKLQSGSYPIYVGSSSRTLPLTGTLSL